MTMKKISTSHFIPSPISISIVCFMSLISNNSKMTFTNWTSVFRLSDPDNKILFESWQQDKKRRFWYLKWLHIKHNHCFYVKYFFNPHYHCQISINTVFLQGYGAANLSYFLGKHQGRPSGGIRTPFWKRNLDMNRKCQFF